MRSFKIENGDYVKDNRGRFQMATDNEAIKQRINNRLVIRRGSFVHDSTLGSRLHLLPQAKPSERESLALEYVREALLPEVQEGVIQKVVSVSVSYPDSKVIQINVLCLLPNGNTLETGVPIN